jgi:hypothetical protein
VEINAQWSIQIIQGQFKLENRLKLGVTNLSHLISTLSTTNIHNSMRIGILHTDGDLLEQEGNRLIDLILMF